MTDYDKFKSFFNGFGIPYFEKYTDSHNDEYFKVIKLKPMDQEAKEHHPHIIEGYYGFKTCFNFNKEGVFSHIGIWE